MGLPLTPSSGECTRLCFQQSQDYIPLHSLNAFGLSCNLHTPLFLRGKFPGDYGRSINHDLLLTISVLKCTTGIIPSSIPKELSKEWVM